MLNLSLQKEILVAAPTLLLHDPYKGSGLMGISGGSLGDLPGKTTDPKGQVEKEGDC